MTSQSKVKNGNEPHEGAIWRNKQRNQTPKQSNCNNKCVYYNTILKDFSKFNERNKGLFKKSYWL